MKHNFLEIITAVFLILVAVLLLNPLHFWMPPMMVVGMLVALLVLCAAFATFVIREKNGDEREEAHRSLAGRNAYLAGAVVIIIGIAVQGYRHLVDPWLVVALLAMIATKLGTRRWFDGHR